jgi:hypothetical protein
MKEYEPPEVTEPGEIEEITHTGTQSLVGNRRGWGHRKKRGRRDGRGHDHDDRGWEGGDDDNGWDW